GNVGEKVKLKLIILEIKHGPDYNPWTLWTFKDEHGNLFKKFGEVNKKYITKYDPTSHDINPETNEVYYNNYALVGDEISVTAEIKEHQEFAGTKSTMLVRLSKY